MNRGLAVVGVFIGVAAIGCDPQANSGSVEAAVTNPDVACDIQGCISISKFSQNLSSLLANNVEGYVSIVGSQPPAFGGYARTAADAPSWLPGGIAMLPDLPTNIASVSKTLTTIGVLRSLARHNISLDSPISPYLWSTWHQGPNINTITFRDLLTHRSGFRESCGGNQTTFPILEQQINQGVQLSDKQNASYNNCNFAIFRELLPFMEGQVYTSNAVNGAPWTWSANFYVNYMNANVFAPVGIPARTCAPPPSGDYWNILSYPYPAGSAHGTDWGDWTLACGGGGWNLSAGDLEKIFTDVAKGGRLLTAQERDEMFTGYLGWDNAVRNDCPSPNVCKNGDLANSNESVWTYAGVFKCNVPVVAVVNSALPSPYQGGSDIVGLVSQAYSNAATTGTPACCASQTACGSTCCDSFTQVCELGRCMRRQIHVP
jgi:hypothetical protein